MRYIYIEKRVLYCIPLYLVTSIIIFEKKKEKVCKKKHNCYSNGEKKIEKVI